MKKATQSMIMAALLGLGCASCAQPDKVDFSEDFRLAETPHPSENFEDITWKLADGELRLDSDFFKSSRHFDGQYYDAPASGVTGKDYRRTDMYFYPHARQSESMIYDVAGKSRLGGIVTDFNGTLTVTAAYHWHGDDGDFYRLIGEYALHGDRKQESGGLWKGVWSANAYCRDGILYVDDSEDVADGYKNRTFVGIWVGPGKMSSPHTCIWGDGRLPYTSDFDIGDGEMMVNAKYDSPEWESYFRGDEIHYPENSDTIVYYKAPWW